MRARGPITEGVRADWVWKITGNAIEETYERGIERAHQIYRFWQPRTSCERYIGSHTNGSSRFDLNRSYWDSKRKITVSACPLLSQPRGLIGQDAWELTHARGQTHTFTINGGVETVQEKTRAKPTFHTRVPWIFSPPYQTTAHLDWSRSPGRQLLPLEENVASGFQEGRRPRWKSSHAPKLQMSPARNSLREWWQWFSNPSPHEWYPYWSRTNWRVELWRDRKLQGRWRVRLTFNAYMAASYVCWSWCNSRSRRFELHQSPQQWRRRSISWVVPVISYHDYAESDYHHSEAMTCFRT